MTLTRLLQERALSGCFKRGRRRHKGWNEVDLGVFKKKPGQRDGSNVTLMIAVDVYEKDRSVLLKAPRASGSDPTNEAVFGNGSRFRQRPLKQPVGKEQSDLP